MDGTEENQDDKTSDDPKGTSEKEPETFTEEQVGERERKAKSDVSAELGRVRKLNEDLIKSSQAIQDRLEKRDRDDDEREREVYKDDPGKLNAITERQGRREAESKLAKKEQELEEEKGKTAAAQEAEAKSTKERNAREIATRLKVDAKTLVKFTDGSAEAMEDLAKSLSKKGDPIISDSGTMIGGSGTIPTTKKGLENWMETHSQEEFEKNSPQINKMMREGKIK